MNAIPFTPLTVEIARRVTWFEPAEIALANPVRFVDPRSWAYWNSKVGRYPAPALPRRTFGGTADRARADLGEDLRRQARQTWLRTRRPVEDPEEVSRRAREECRAKYGSKEQK